MSSTRQADGGVKSARRVLEILELMTSRGEPLSLNDIVTNLELPRSSAHNLMATLVGAGFVRQQADKTYALSAKWLALVSAALGTASRTDLADLRHVAYPIMLRTANELSMTCNLAVLHRSNVVYVDKVNGRGTTLQIATHVGAMFPAHVTGLGKSILSSLEESELERWIEKHFDHTQLTPKSITSEEELHKDLEKARKQGYAIDDEESHLGVLCIAAPVLNADGEPVAAISISGIKPVVESRGIESVAAAIKQAASEVSSALVGMSPEAASRSIG